MNAMFQKGAARPNQRSRQFWQRNNHPIQLWSARVINIKVNCIHNNPVKAGFVEEPYYWRLSSAIDYSGGKGLLDIEMV
jgi:hypothetical protein